VWKAATATLLASAGATGVITRPGTVRYHLGNGDVRIVEAESVTIEDDQFPGNGDVVQVSLTRREYRALLGAVTGDTSDTDALTTMLARRWHPSPLVARPALVTGRLALVRQPADGNIPRALRDLIGDEGWAVLQPSLVSVTNRGFHLTPTRSPIPGDLLAVLAGCGGRIVEDDGVCTRVMHDFGEGQVTTWQPGLRRLTWFPGDPDDDIPVAYLSRVHCAAFTAMLAGRDHPRLGDALAALSTQV
jgi:hypothetical protein